MCPNRQAGQVLRARDNEQRLCNQEQEEYPRLSRILTQLLPFSGLAGDELRRLQVALRAHLYSPTEELRRLPLAPSTSPHPRNTG